MANVGLAACRLDHPHMVGVLEVAEGKGQVVSRVGPGVFAQGAAICLNSRVVVDGLGRATIRFSDQAATYGISAGSIISLGENTAVEISAPKNGGSWLMELIRGWFRFQGPPSPRVQVKTKYLMAGVRGTEFVVWHRDDACLEEGHSTDNASCSILWLQEGRVEVDALTYVAGRSTGNKIELIDESDEQRAVIARFGQGLMRNGLTISPEDAVNWVVYYPPLTRLDLLAADAGRMPGSSGRDRAERTSVDCIGRYRRRKAYARRCDRLQAQWPLGGA